MRRHAILTTALMALAAIALLAAPAGAAPWQQQWLPDADLYCGAGLTHEVDGFTGYPMSGTLFVDDDTYGGHYVVVESKHYVFEEALFGPVDDFSGTQPVDERFYGKKTGLERVACQVVSRWEGLGTVVAPIVLAPVS